MIRKPFPWLGAIVSACALPLLGFSQASDLGERVLALKQTLERDQAALRKYEWIETTAISLKGEEKSRTQNRCYYGADGKLQKVPVSATQADMPGGRRGRMAARKKEDITDYMERAAGLIQQYIPPNPAVLQKVFQAGRTAGQVLEPGRRGRLEFREYLMPGDMLGIEVDLTNNHILGVQVATYLDKPEDSVSLQVKFATLADGTGYAAETTLDATKEKVRVITQNSGYKPMAR